MTDEHLHATVSLRGVVVDRRSRVLVVRRASDGGWELPGGRIGPREAPRAGLCRELDEETDLGVEVRTPVYTYSWRNDADEGRFAVYYLCRPRDREVSLSAEHVDAAWVRPTEAATRLSGPQSTALAESLRTHDGRDPDWA